MDTKVKLGDRVFTPSVDKYRGGTFQIYGYVVKNNRLTGEVTKNYLLKSRITDPGTKLIDFSKNSLILSCLQNSDNIEVFEVSDEELKTQWLVQPKMPIDSFKAGDDVLVDGQLKRVLAIKEQIVVICDPTNGTLRTVDFCKEYNIDPNEPIMVYHYDPDRIVAVKKQENESPKQDVVTVEVTDTTKVITTIEQLIKMKNDEKAADAQPTSEEKDSVKQSFMTTLKAEGTEAAWRIGARQISRASRRVLVNLLKVQGFKKAQIKVVTDLLETDYGHAIVAYLLGVMLPHIPQIKNDPRIQKLCEEFRIEGMAISGDALLSDIFAGVMPHVGDFLNTLPAVEKATAMNHRIAVKQEEDPVLPDLVKEHKIAEDELEAEEEIVLLERQASGI